MIIVFKSFTYKNKNYSNCVVSVSYKRKDVGNYIQEKIQEYYKRMLRKIKLKTKGELFNIRIHRNEDQFIEDDQFIKVVENVSHAEIKNETELINIFNSKL